MGHSVGSGGRPTDQAVRMDLNRLTLASNASGDGHHTTPPSTTVAPVESEWYHGRLDRSQSEDRLKRSGKANCYLVRESDRKPGSYVLSFLGRTGVNHFRVTAVCGDYYIGGRQFDSLQDLIDYYTNKSDLLKNERLHVPVPPPEPVNDKKRMIAILPYTKMPDTDELSFEKGDIFFVHNEVNDGWLWTTSHRTGEQGLIFGELMSPLDEDPNIDPNSVFPWFHKHITKDRAVELLVAGGAGSYLVRPSDNSPGDYSLFFHVANQIQRFRIEKKAGGMRYAMGGRTFHCLQAVIDRYKTEAIFEGHTLSHYVKKTVNETSDEAMLPIRHEEPEKSAAERIYATLRECREQAEPKHQRGVKMQGYLVKRKAKSSSSPSNHAVILGGINCGSGGSAGPSTAAKWKQLFFVLKQDESDTHLYFYDNPKRTKPKGLIDLSCCSLYQVDDSCYDRRHCFQLVERALPCLATTTVLACDDASEYDDWMEIIRPLCMHQNGIASLLASAVSSSTASSQPAAVSPASTLSSTTSSITVNGSGGSCASAAGNLRQTRSVTLTVSEVHRLAQSNAPSLGSTKSQGHASHSPLRSGLTNANNNAMLYYALLTYGGQGGTCLVPVARTAVRQGPSPVFDETFQLEHVPSDVTSLTVTLICRSLTSSDGHSLGASSGGGVVGIGADSRSSAPEREVGSVTIDLPTSVASYGHPVEWDKWVPMVISGIQQNIKPQVLAGCADGGGPTMRLRVRYVNDLVLPEREYASLKELLLDSRLDVVRALADVCRAERALLANAVLRIFRFDKREADLLTAMNGDIIAAEQEMATLFRGASLATSLMDAYMRSVCGEFVTTAIDGAVRRIFDAPSRVSCLINPAHVASAAEANANADFLLSVLDDLTESIFMSSEACPRTLRYVFYCLQRDVTAQWPNDRLVKTRVVTGFVFLRLICPAIINARQRSALTVDGHLAAMSVGGGQQMGGPASSSASIGNSAVSNGSSLSSSSAATAALSNNASGSSAVRSLVTLAKCVQMLANLTEFNSISSKEPHMEVVNPFIIKNKNRMVVFIDHLSSIRKKPYPDEERVKGDPGADLATVHLLCEAHLDDLHRLAKMQPTVKTLVTVTEMLSRHKKRYLSLMAASGGGGGGSGAGSTADASASVAGLA